MKVAIVLNTSWNIYNFRMSFVNSLLKQGYEVHTIAPRDEYTDLLIQAGCKHHHVRMDSRGANPIKDMALIAELGLIYYKIQPNIILHYTIKPNVYGTIAATILRIPVINNVCGLGTVFLKGGLVSKVAILLYRIAFRFPKKVFFQNTEDLQLFQKLKLVEPDVADILPGSGIDASAYMPSPFKRAGKFTFLLVSRLIYDKGIQEYIDAIKILRKRGVNERFQLLGAVDTEHSRGIPLNVINEWINDGIVEYLGKTNDIRPYMNMADCIVLPSYREGSPRSLMEAACLGKPIITTNVAGCRQVVQDGVNGLLCELQSADDLAKKMLAMIELPFYVRQLMGRKGREKMEKEFSDQIIIKKYSSAMLEILLQGISPSVELAA